jgi:Spy/CpxP family protein refolding chaperone
MKLPIALVCSVVLAFAASAAPAQSPSSGGGPGRSGFAERRMQALLKGITVTAEQQAKIDSIRARYSAQLPAFTPGTRPDSTTRAKMRELFRHQDDEIRGVLTADQQKTWDENVAEMRARRPGGQ